VTARPVRIVAIGDELLEGRTSDTNSTRIERALGPHAASVADIVVVHDQLDAIAGALDRSGEGDLVFVCGGLGCTQDDLTREAIAAWAGVPLQHREDIAAQIARRYEERGIPRHVDGDKQALAPAGLAAVANPVGIAPGLVGELHGRVLAVLPGVPAELDALLPGCLDQLASLGALPPRREVRLWRTAQMAELAVARQTEPVRARFPALAWSWWLVDWGVDVRIAADREQEAILSAAAHELDRILGDTVYAHDLVSLPRVIQDLMQARGETLAVAESCTGGLLGAAITSEDGSSTYYRGGVLSYANEVKANLLGVDPAEIDRSGAVSRPVVEAMARGARDSVGADWALAVTGIAGPGGGTPEKPVGTTWIAVAGPTGAWSGRYRFTGDRQRNRRLAVAAALDALRRTLVGHAPFAASELSWGVEA
jgi:nicotinamide-nucleotide amidase